MYNSCKICNSDVLTENRTYSLVRCQSCDLVFCSKEYRENDFKVLYDNLYNVGNNPKYEIHSGVEYNEMKSGKIAIGYNRRKLIKKNVRASDRVLEIGSGNGLVGLFLKKNFDVQYTGIEIDHETSKKAIAFGLNVINSDYKVIQNLSEKFDVIMMWEVLEHIQDLDFCLKLLKKSLSENGRIILSVPNYDKRLNYNNRKDKLYQSKVEHIGSLSKAN